jgi:hypothetical protein
VYSLELRELYLYRVRTYVYVSAASLVSSVPRVVKSRMHGMSTEFSQILDHIYTHGDQAELASG